MSLENNFVNNNNDYEKFLDDSDTGIVADGDNSRSEFEKHLDSLRSEVMSPEYDIKALNNINAQAFSAMCKEWLDCDINEDCFAALVSGRIDILERITGVDCIDIYELYNSCLIQHWDVTEMYESSVTNDDELFTQNFIPELAQYTGILFYISREDAKSIERIKKVIIDKIDSMLKFGGGHRE